MKSNAIADGDAGSSRGKSCQTDDNNSNEDVEVSGHPDILSVQHLQAHVYWLRARHVETKQSSLWQIWLRRTRQSRGEEECRECRTGRPVLSVVRSDREKIKEPFFVCAFFFLFFLLLLAASVQATSSAVTLSLSLSSLHHLLLFFGGLNHCCYSVYSH